MMRPVDILGFEPPMFRGLSGSELTGTLLLSLLPGAACSLAARVVAGSWLWALPILVVAALLSVLGAGTALLRLKRNHVPNWYLQRLARRFARRAGLVWRDGVWRIDLGSGHVPG